MLNMRKTISREKQEMLNIRKTTSREINKKKVALKEEQKSKSSDGKMGK